MSFPGSYILPVRYFIWGLNIDVFCTAVLHLHVCAVLVTYSVVVLSFSKYISFVLNDINSTSVLAKRTHTCKVSCVIYALCKHLFLVEMLCHSGQVCHSGLCTINVADIF